MILENPECIQFKNRKQYTITQEGSCFIDRKPTLNYSKNMKQSDLTLRSIEKLLEQKLDRVVVDVREEIQLSEIRTDKKLTKLRDEVLAGNDKIVNELEAIREEQILSAGQYRDHEKRILDLEKIQGAHQ